MSSLSERDRRVLWHPYTQHGIDPEPLPVAAARGAILTLEDGRELIDGISSWWTCLHGHAHPKIVQAMAAQAAELDHVIFAGATHRPAVELGERLVELAPEGLARVFYSDNGSTAVEVALKMTYQACVHRGEPERTVFIALEGSYHGDTFGAMSIGDPVPFFEPYGPFLFEVVRIPPEAEALGEAFKQHAGRIAALIAEPLVLGAGGMRMVEAAFYRRARELTRAEGALLIADEVMTGFGRTGTRFACEQAGVAPDLMCLAKGLTNGMLPLAVTLATEELFEAFLSEERSRFFPHGHSMTANPIGCAVALASLEVGEETDVLGRLSEIGRTIENRLEGLRGDPRVANLRRLGGIVAFDRVVPPEKAGYLSNVSLHVRRDSIERGVLLRPLGNVIYALPPACTSEEQCDRIAEAMIASIDCFTA